MKISIEKLFPLLMQQQSAVEKSISEYTLDTGSELPVKVVVGSQKLWFITVLNDQSHSDDVDSSLYKILQAVMANAADYDDSLSLCEQGKLLLQRSISVNAMTEDELLDGFYAHSAFAQYLYPLLERKESISWQHLGIIHP